jgi:hypothetical protein
MIPVGRDCDCGYPLVWRLGEKWCAVYGSHPLPDHARVQNTDAPFAELVLEIDGEMQRKRRATLRAVPAA